MGRPIPRGELLAKMIAAVPAGWMLMKHYAELHKLRYNILYARAIVKKIETLRFNNHLFVRADMDPQQFRVPFVRKWRRHVI